MKKPTSVEDGQWWATSGMGAPFRVESVSHERGVAIHSGGHGETSVARLLEQGEYLGRSDNPAPSPWMVDTLAEHAWSLYQADTMDPREWKDATNEERETRRSYARMIVHGGSGRTRFEHYAVKSLYRILRDLGKW